MRVTRPTVRGRRVNLVPIIASWRPLVLSRHPNRAGSGTGIGAIASCRGPRIFETAGGASHAGYPSLATPCRSVEVANFTAMGNGSWRPRFLEQLRGSVFELPACVVIEVDL
jgi:hypothetical protein